MIQLRQPETRADFTRYYELRWQVLRAPWQQPRGSERDELEDDAFHLLAEDEQGRLLGVARLHWNTPEQAQIRYMAVNESARGTGIGRALLTALEAEAARRDTAEIMLHARESVVGFYVRNGYEMIAPSHVLFGDIQHYRMTKTLSR